MTLIIYQDKQPKIGDNVFIAQNSFVIGGVEIGKNSSIWFGTIVRGDVANITIGENSNIQDNSVIHVTRPNIDTHIGSNVTIGHRALLHGCEIQDYGFVGMGAIIMDRAVVEEFSMVAAGALITPGKIVRSKEIWAGNPGRFMRYMTEEELAYIKISADNYVKDAKYYQETLSGKGK